MRPEPADLKHLWDMLEGAREAGRIVEGRTLESHRGDRVRQLALERVLEIIGEAARRVSEPTRERVALPWRAIIATRNVLAHEYDEVDVETVWRIATLHVPELVVVIAPLLAASPPGPEAEKDPGQP